MDRMLIAFNQRFPITIPDFIKRKKKDGASVGDIRRLVHQQGCFKSRCPLCHDHPVTKSSKKIKGKKNKDRKYDDPRYFTRDELTLSK